jgi:hypothetical protein
MRPALLLMVCRTLNQARCIMSGQAGLMGVSRHAKRLAGANPLHYAQLLTVFCFRPRVTMSPLEIATDTPVRRRRPAPF